MSFLVLVNCYLVFCWFAPCSQANQPMIQKFEETWCVKISSYRTFHGITDLSFRSNFYIHCHFKILGLTRTAILIVKLSGCRYTFGRNASVSCICQFQLRPAPPPPLPGLLRSVPRVEHFSNFVLPGAIPELLTRTRFPIRI